MFLIILLFLSFIFCVTILIIQKCRSKKIDQGNTTKNDLTDNTERGNTVSICSPHKSNRSHYTPIETHLKQMLESAEIILTTKNVDIFLSRFEFMKGLSERISSERDDTTYAHHLSNAIEMYRNLYYNKITTEDQLTFVMDLNTVYSDHVFGRNLYLCYERFCDRMQEDMDSLKTQKAKHRRIDKIREVSKLMTPYISSEIHLVYANQILSMITQRFGIEFDVSVKNEA